MEDLKRGVDLGNRFWDGNFARKIKEVFHWRKGKPINKVTFLSLFVIILINSFLISGLSRRDLSSSFSSSYFLMLISSLFENIGISKAVFFGAISMLSLFFAPINIYLFARKISQRHELTAFIATFLFVVPNPISEKGLPLIYGLLNGDGAHVLAFSITPLLLLYLKAFLEKGLFAWAFLTSIITAFIAVISPFAFFNLLILFFILTVSEGFIGGIRINFARLFFVLAASFGLSFFWYHPQALKNIFFTDSMGFAVSYFWNIFPIFIPLVPVIGAISFLVFDRREKLQPLFISIFMFLAYFILYRISLGYNSEGIFMPDRYSIELSFGTAFLFSFILGFFIDFSISKFSFFKQHKYQLIAFFLISAFVFFTILMTLSNISLLRGEIESMETVVSYKKGVGSVRREVLFSNFSSIIGSLITLSTFVLFFYALKYYPVSLNKKKDLH